MKIFVIGSSIISSYWNGAATYYRGLYRSLARLGHEVTFAEPDAYGRQQKRDAGDYSYVRSWVYRTPDDLPQVLDAARGADLVIKHSGVGADDELLEREAAGLRSENTLVAFWDVDAPATLARVEQDAGDPFRALIPKFDLIFTYGGGQPVIEHYIRLGAASCRPIYNAVDPDLHHPVAADPRFICDLAFVGNRLPDREHRVEDFFLHAAELCPDLRFILGGEGWSGKALPANVEWVGHVGTGDHNVINCSARMVLNVNRESMAHVGFSPPTRVFEAAGSGACLVTDRWPGIEEFFTPGKEILVADSGEQVARFLRDISRSDAAVIGHNMRERALREHTYTMRGGLVDSILRDTRTSLAAV